MLAAHNQFLNLHEGKLGVLPQVDRDVYQALIPESFLAASDEWINYTRHRGLLVRCAEIMQCADLPTNSGIHTCICPSKNERV